MEVSSNSFNYIKNSNIAFVQHFGSYPICNYRLPNQPKDTFEKSTATNPVELKEYKQPSFYGKWLNKENLIIGGSGLALSGAIAAVAIVKGKGLRSALKTAQKAANAAQDVIQENSKVIDGLKAEISNLTKITEDLQLPKAEMKKKYLDKLKDAVLGYDPLKPPAKKIARNGLYCEPKAIYKFEDVLPLKLTSTVSDIVDTSLLKKQLQNNGSISIILPKTSAQKIATSSDAYIAGKDIPNLGVPTLTDIKLAYGKRVNWSESKIARDIMQNFYDGHGHTLDGVKITVEKVANGEHKIKISGLAQFDYENLQYLGSGEKVLDLANAGGFGEGSKIVVANLLGKQDTKAVKFACADWELIYDSSKGIMRRTLNKVATPIEGNSIEFTTSNQKLVDAVVDSVNYFQHSKNPDFQGLTYDSPFFSLKYLNPNEKGNIYLTQRFEFEKDGVWDEGLERLSLMFKQKPDPKEYERIIGSPLPKDRDRTYLTFNDIENLTRYFATKMSDDDLIKVFVGSKSNWGNVKIGEDSALKSFLSGLCTEIYRRDLRIDFSKTDFVAANKYLSDVEKEFLRNYNLKPCFEFFDKAGMKTAREFLQETSIHKALTPTTDEVKKLKLLEEGVRAVYEDIQLAVKKHCSTPRIKFADTLSSDDYWLFSSYISDPKMKQLVSKYDKFDLTDAQKVESLINLKKEAETLISSYFERLSKNPNDVEARQYIAQITDSHFSNKISPITNDYFNTYKSFNLINESDIAKPRFIFDRHSELGKDTLGESIVERNGSDGSVYLGHWVDRDYLKSANFNEMMSTWLHEICHKSGGDGSAEFTYTLTDMLKVLLSSNSQSTSKVKLAALEDIYNALLK